MIRILLADDHTIMREGLKQLFALVGDIQICSEAASGAELLEQLRHKEVDLVLLDMSMPGISGEDLIIRVRSHYPALPILVLSMHNEPQVAQRALRAGANGYVTKDRDPETLLFAVRRVASGKRFIDPLLAEQIAFGGSGLTAKAQHETLTEREAQILRLIAGGLSVNEIAELLTISNKTVSTHKARLMEKMGFSGNADLIRYALTHGLIV